MEAEVWTRWVSLMRRSAGVTAAAMLLGCSAQGSIAPTSSAVTEPSRSLPSVGVPPLENRPLADLRKKVKGKVVLFHADHKAEQPYWTAEVRLGSAFKVAVDCVGSREILVMHAVDSFQFNRQCFAGYTTYTVDNYPPKPLKTRQLKVHAPHGAKWAILVVRLPST